MSDFFKKAQLAQLVSAHFKEVLREPAVLFWGIIFPILISLGLGVAFTQSKDTLHHIAVISVPLLPGQLSQGTASIDSFLKNNARGYLQPGDESGHYRIVIPDDTLGSTIFVFRHTDWQTATRLLKRGEIALILEEKNGDIRYFFDPSNKEAQLTHLKINALLSSSATGHGPRQPRVSALTVSGTRYIDFLVPGLIAMNIMMSCMWGLSYGIIEKRSQKLLRRMVATPMKKSHFLISLMLVRITMNLIEALLLFLFAHIAFGIAIQGSVAALLAVFLSGNLAFAGIAVFVSSHTQKTEIGNGLINAIVMPMMVLSGIFFSYHHFPDWSLPFIRHLPLTLLADGFRRIFIEGVGMADALFPIVILAIIGTIFFTAGLKIFKWH